MGEFLKPSKDWYLFDDWGADQTDAKIGYTWQQLGSKNKQTDRLDRLALGVFVVHNKGFNVLYLDGHVVTQPGGLSLEDRVQTQPNDFWGE
jgi:prepilin-type processing-associated H-X9-DG protein